MQNFEYSWNILGNFTYDMEHLQKKKMVRQKKSWIILCGVI